MRKLIHNPGKILEGYIRNGQTVIDIGCGPGFFTIPMARLVGEKGHVIAVDVQKKMLEYVYRRGEKEGLLEQIHLHQCTNRELGVREYVDFALAFYVAHEVPNIDAFFKEVVKILRPHALFLLVEPKLHVTMSRFREMIWLACSIGLTCHKELKVRGSRAILFSLE